MNPIDNLVPALDPSPYMDLAKLLAQGENSPVLRALANICDYTICVKRLRLVSKDISRLALLGLIRYTLRFRGGPRDTNVRAASLLQGAKLSEVFVQLRLSGW